MECRPTLDVYNQLRLGINVFNAGTLKNTLVTDFEREKLLKVGSSAQLAWKSEGRCAYMGGDFSKKAVREVWLMDGWLYFCVRWR